MKKALIIVLIIGILAALGYLHQKTKAPTTPKEGETMTREGTITSVDLDSIAFDGPAIVTFQQEDGESTKIEVPSMGLPLCAASDRITDVYELGSGDRIRVTGEVSPNGAIVPCQSEEHELTLLSEG
jgi:hypothetical protein